MPRRLTMIMLAMITMAPGVICAVNSLLTVPAHRFLSRNQGRDAPMGLSLRNAAKEAGVSKSTILRAIQSGRLSAPRTDDGGYDIDPAELFRVYDPAKPERNGTDAEGQGAPANQNTPDPMAAALQAQIDGLKEILRRADEAAAELKQEREDLKQDRDKWRSMAENQQRLITDTNTRSWWQRLVG